MAPRSRSLLLAWVLALLGQGCTSGVINPGTTDGGVGGAAPGGGGGAGDPGASPPDLAASPKPPPLPLDESVYFGGLLLGAAQMKSHCDQVVQATVATPPTPPDGVSGPFCKNHPASYPTLTGLSDLMSLLGFSWGTIAPNGTWTGSIAGFVLTGNSSSLVARDVSAINPRAIIYRYLKPGELGGPPVGATSNGFLIMTFARGEQLAELATYDGTTLQFYVVHFAQACNATKTCTYGDLFTPAIEKNWTATTLYEDNEVPNSIFSCLECHAQGAAVDASPRLLRMPENKAPYTHFFSQFPVGQALLADFHAAHGSSEDYGPIPAALIDKSDPARFAAFINSYPSLSTQPNPLDIAQIEKEVEASNMLQPAVNIPAGVSATWQAAYNHAVLGNAIAPPYHDAKITDPNKLATMTDAYKKVIAGTMPRYFLPDLREVILDAALPDLTFKVKAGLDGAGILVQACHQCHNPGVDQMQSKALFDVTKLATMAATEKQKAIARLNLPVDNILHMPPTRFRSLSPEEIGLVTTVLSK